MSMFSGQDELLRCRDCGNEFVFSTGEQRFFEEKGLNKKPVRCKNCRAMKKNQNNAQVQSQQNQPPVNQYGGQGYPDDNRGNRRQPGRGRRSGRRGDYGNTWDD